MKQTRRTFVQSAAAAAGLSALANTATAATDSVIDDAPVVASATYPTVGTDPANPTATVFGNFKCPYTRDFVLNNFDDVVQEFVETGRLNLRFRAVAYEPFPSDPSHGSADWYISSSDPRISEAGLGVWNVDPNDYWQYFLDMFQNQVSGYVTLNDLADRMAASGVEGVGTITDRTAAGRYENGVVRSKQAARAAGLQWTPWMEFMGDTVSPHHGYAGLSDWLDARIPDVTAETRSASDGPVGEFGDEWVGQVGPGQWHALEFATSYDDPVVVANGLSANGADPAHVRLGGVDADGARYRIEEWDYLDGGHTPEKVCYLGAETGVHALPGGSAFEVGRFDATHRWRGVGFDADFGRAPVVLSHPQTYNGWNAIVTRQRSVSADGFDARLQEQEAWGAHATESVGYVAVTPGTDRLDGVAMEAGVTGERVDGSWTRVEFDRTYSSPLFVAAAQTTNGHQPAAVRYRALTGSSVEIRMEEERSQDRETAHVPERVGFLVAEDR